MADLPPDRDPTSDDATSEPVRSAAPGTPRWVLVLGLIAVVLIVAFVVQAVLGGGHGPQMHAPSSDAGGQAASSSPSHQTADVGGQVDGAHATRTVEVTALDTWQFSHAGTLEFACHEPGHYETGMRGQLIVS